jgi:dolichol-phosphate mannosyltransferase
MQTNATEDYEFTIIVPVFNEEDNMEHLGKRLVAYLPTCILRACVLFVNDGSKDCSLKYIKEICQRHKDFFYISLAENSGLSTAIKAGIDTVTSPYVGYIDSDLQTAPEDFNLLLRYANDYQLVTGIRVNRKDSFIKRSQSHIANKFRRMMTSDNATDTGCPLKVLQTSYAQRIPFFNGMHRFIPALILLEKGKVKELPVSHYPRLAGVSKYHLWNRLSGPFIDCFAYRWMKNRYIHYHIINSNVKTE